MLFMPDWLMDGRLIFRPPLVKKFPCTPMLAILLTPLVQFQFDFQQFKAKKLTLLTPIYLYARNTCHVLSVPLIAQDI